MPVLCEAPGSLREGSAASLWLRVLLPQVMQQARRAEPTILSFSLAPSAMATTGYSAHKDVGGSAAGASRDCVKAQEVGGGGSRAVTAEELINAISHLQPLRVKIHHRLRLTDWHMQAPQRDSTEEKRVFPSFKNS